MYYVIAIGQTIKILTQVQYSRPQKATPLQNTLYDGDIVKTGPPIFWTIHSLTRP